MRFLSNLLWVLLVVVTYVASQAVWREAAESFAPLSGQKIGFQRCWMWVEERFVVDMQGKNDANLWERVCVVDDSFSQEVHKVEGTYGNWGWYEVATDDIQQNSSSPAIAALPCRIPLFFTNCADFLQGKTMVKVWFSEQLQALPPYQPVHTSSSSPASRRLATYCHPTCSTCSDELSTGCLSCRPDLQLTASNTCICAAGYYPAPTAANCQSCHPTCATCSDSGESYCKSCHPNATKQADYSCKCNAGYGLTGGFCELCAVSCMTCYYASSASSCLSCGAGQSISNSGRCVCAQGLYPAAVGVCDPCASECKNCVGSTATDCIQCFFYAYLIGTEPTACMCYSGYGGAPNVCSKCDVSCLTCSLGMSASACTSCFSPAALSSNVCVCPSGTYMHPIAGNCRLCSSSCKECTGDSVNTCTLCAPNAYLESGTSPDRCLCGDGVNTPPNCLICPATCRLCNASGCQACFSNAELSLGSCVCSSGFYGSAEHCLLCDGTCLTCSGPGGGQCLACKANAVLNGSGSCICTSGFFGTADTCAPCYSSLCLTCANSSTCSMCVSNAHLNSSSVCICDSGFYMSTSTCAPCDVSCKECDRPGVNGCTQCWDTAQVTGVKVGSCSCPATFYFYSSTKICLSCFSPKCKTCIGPLQGDCLVCINSYLVAGDCQLCDPSCVQTCNPSSITTCVNCDSSCAFCGSGVALNPCICGAGKYLSGAICVSCHSSCAECSSALTCSKCPPNSLLDSGGVCICRNSSETPPNCVSFCHISCKTCSGAGGLNCGLCDFPRILSGGFCVCPSQTYPNPTVVTCSSCNAACLECVGPGPTDCTSCPSGYALRGTGYKSTCEIIPCTPTCSVCDVGPANQCLSCSDSNTDLTGGVCSCKTGFYPDGQSFRCVACPSVCKACTLNFLCTGCYLHASPVVSGDVKICACYAGYYPDTTAVNCVLCHSTCYKCTGPSDSNCSGCPVNSTLSGGFCLCNGGFYRPDLVSACLPCASACSTCLVNDPLQCRSCKSNAHLIAASPAACTCDDGFYPSPDPSSCPRCPIPCSKCTSTSVCTECKSITAMVSGTVCECSNGYYANTPLYSCEPCDPRCATCLEGTFRDCVTCYPHASPVTLKPLKIRCDCDNHYYYNSNNVCTPCDPSCFNCISSEPSLCTECYPKAHLLASTPPSECVCVEGLYPFPNAGNCLPCEFTCFHCVGPLASDCTDCSNFAELEGSVPSHCQCVSNAYPDPDSAHCTMCQQECASCINNNIASCTRCWPGAFLRHTPPSDCLCNPGSYPSPDASNCLLCASSCWTCQGAFECLSCKSKAVLVGTECVCETGFYPYPDAGNCLKCGEFCENCDLSGCLICKKEYFLLAKGCVSTCPPEFNPDINAHFCALKDPTPPVPSLSVSDLNNLILSFNTNITSSLSQADLSISITQPSAIYIQVLWSAPSFTPPNTLGIDLTIQSSALENNSYVMLTFLSPDKVKSGDGVTMTTENISGMLNPYGDLESNATVLTEMQVTQQTTTIGQSSVAVAATASILTGSPTSFLSAININQLLTYIPLSKIALPERFAAALSGMNMRSIMITPISLPSLPENYSEFQPLDHVVNYGIDTMLFLPNAIGIFVLWGIVLMGYLGIYLMTLTSYRVMVLYCRTLLKSLTWEVPLLLYFSSYLDLGIQSSFQIIYSSGLSLNPYVLLNFSGACLAFACFLAVPALLLAFIHRHYSQITHREDLLFLERWGVLTEQFKQTGAIPSAAYYVVFLLRRLIMGLTLVVGMDYPVLFGLINTATCFTALIYTLVWRPFQTKMDQIDAIWAESTITLIYSLSTFYLLDLNPYIYSLFEEIGVWAVRAVMMLTAVSSIIRIGITFHKMLSLYAKIRKMAEHINRAKSPVKTNFAHQKVIRFT